MLRKPLLATERNRCLCQLPDRLELFPDNMKCGEPEPSRQGPVRNPALALQQLPHLSQNFIKGHGGSLLHRVITLQLRSRCPTVPFWFNQGRHRAAVTSSRWLGGVAPVLNQLSVRDRR